MRIGYVPERDLEVAKKEASDWEAKYRQSEEARAAAETWASEAEAAVTAAVEAAKKERSHGEDLLKEQSLKYANLEKLIIAVSGDVLGKFLPPLFLASPRACRVPERAESPSTLC